MEDYKYLAIVDWVKDYIASEKLKPNDRFLTEKELCAIHGVSRQTVRQALMKLESDNVICRVRGSGTFVKGDTAEPPAPRPRTGSIGVVSTYFSDYIFPHIVTGIESVLNDAGYTMQLAITHNMVSEEKQALRNMLDNGVCGLIVEPSKSALPNPNYAIYNEIRSLGIPLVFFNAKYGWSDFPYVAMDDEAAGRLVADYLFDCGHCEISGLFVLDNIQGHKRYSGFMKSCIDHGRTDAEQSVLWYGAGEVNRVFTYEKKRVLELLESSTAIVCYNDMLAVSLLGFCRENGIRVPDDLSVVGIDDSKYASICDVPLTTARHPHRKLGEAAAEALLRIMDEGGDEDVGDILFKPELVTRASVRQIGRAVSVV